VTEGYARAAAFVRDSQIAFFAFLLVCVLLDPTGTQTNRGVSYYGDYALTRLPFTLAFLGAILLWLAAVGALPPTRLGRRLAVLFRVIAALLLAIMISTYSLAQAVITLHVTLGVTFFTVQGLAGIWLAGWVCPDRPALVRLALLVAAGLAALLALMGLWPWLILWQVIYQVMFAGIVLHVLRWAEDASPFITG
jgi:hypothetical protein